MASRYNHSISFVLAFCLLPTILYSASPEIRVLLAEAPLNEPTTWVITANHELTLAPAKENDRRVSLGSQISIQATDTTIIINGKKKLVRAPLRIDPVTADGVLHFGTRSYQGALLIIPYKTNTLLINSIELERYVLCVLRSESWPGWPLEVDKALAIACRSYAVAKMLEAQASKLPYHIKNTNAHQTYHGHHTVGTLRRAVQETEGVILGYQKKPVLAMFDCCCGGLIPALIENVDFSKAPYLARTKACTYCASCKIYSWRKTVSKKELTERLQKKFPQIKKLERIEITRRDAAGTIQRVAIHYGTKNPLIISGKKLYGLLPEAKSFCFTIDNTKDTFTITGRGYGHHLGLCQWGVRQMVREGWHYEDILQFFYPGVSFMKIS